ncbi:alginate lyase family protein [Pantoea ananatis]|uniref:alginate lyase family protein n=1 Tax=Pantoea ananas TaxID=553 RepID=UPI001F4E2839|nr:alginate lyase family protein [Pantoea ananatis]MCH9272262.1 alginate lyase family protein [Pantoea ananatis]
MNNHHKPLSNLLTLSFLFYPFVVCASNFTHPGALNTLSDYQFMALQVKNNEQPWSNDFKLLRSNKHDSTDYKPNPVPVIYRGTAFGHHKENYSRLFNDAAAAYALALDWRISGDKKRAERAVDILTSWSDMLHSIDGTSDKYLASGIYGYQLAVAGETLKGFSGFPPSKQEKLKKMLVSIFAQMNDEFLRYHNGKKMDHYWANWDLANTASLMAIGIFSDRRDLYDEAHDYYLHGGGNGTIQHAAWKTYPDSLVQWQESGRDQSHTLLGIGLAGIISQLAWNQGDDLFSSYDNRLLGAARYVARYNSGESVPFTPYINSDVKQYSISDKGRAQKRPVWALIYAHYLQKMHLKAPEITEIMKNNGVEGGGGDYGPNSGGYDQLGYGTLTFIR